ncbi:hypothetical protein BaRGS_00017506 [Batillaria attramentaria]|uniref:Uncharacterized protein n=1 Tax=Batillaria attramentaria TaxID=370345 RepID=A0ABD0KVW0_9CAEN
MQLVLRPDFRYAHFRQAKNQARWSDKCWFVGRSKSSAGLPPLVQVHPRWEGIQLTSHLFVFSSDKCWFVGRSKSFAFLQLKSFHVGKESN